MKKLKYILVVFFCVFSLVSFSQMLAPEDPGGEPTGGDDPIGGGAPIGAGTIILLSLGAAYGSRKAYKHRKSKK